MDREPAFTVTVQIGIVVRDLETTMKRYVDEYGIGPWEIYEFQPENLEDFQEYGAPVRRSWRLAATMVGQVQWELIQPLDDESIYARSSPRRARASITQPLLLRGSTTSSRRKRKRAANSHSKGSLAA